MTGLYGLREPTVSNNVRICNVADKKNYQVLQATTNTEHKYSVYRNLSIFKLFQNETLLSNHINKEI